MIRQPVALNSPICSCFNCLYMIFMNDEQVTIVRNEEGGNSVSTVVLQGSTDSILDDLERAVDDGVNTYKVPFAEYKRYTHGMMGCLLDAFASC